MSKIVHTEVTENSISIILENGVSLSLSSNNNYFHISMSRVKLPLKWGYSIENASCESNNTINCFYEPAYYND
jgi:hypothetical protein